MTEWKACLVESKETQIVIMYCDPESLLLFSAKGTGQYIGKILTYLFETFGNYESFLVHHIFYPLAPEMDDLSLGPEGDGADLTRSL